MRENMTNIQRVPGKRGLIPHDPTKPTLVLDEHLAADAPPVPSVVDWMSEVAEWPMYANDQWGDCVEAAGAHALESVTRYGTGTTVEVSDSDVLGWYSVVGDFDPHAGPPGENPTDQGTMIADFLDYWRKTGLNSHKILAHGMVKDPAKVKSALNTFGVLILGVDLPASAEDQFNTGQPWTVVTGSQILGGHCIVAARYDVDPKAITWGGEAELSLPWWAKYVTEVHFVVSPEWVEATTGRTPSGVDMAGLGADFTSLTGQPAPWATPTPAPAPGPPPDAADMALVSALGPWSREHHLGGNEAAAKAFRAWARAKGL